MNPIELLREQFNSHIDLREKRPGVLQLVAPLFHEDGDMMDIFLFQRNKLKFKSIAVHEDIDKLGRKDRNRLTNACDKQFTSLDEFKQNAISYLEREIA